MLNLLAAGPMGGLHGQYYGGHSPLCRIWQEAHQGAATLTLFNILCASQTNSTGKVQVQVMHDTRSATYLTSLSTEELVLGELLTSQNHLRNHQHTEGAAGCARRVVAGCWRL